MAAHVTGGGWCCLAITLAFDSSPIKGEGDMVVHRRVDARHPHTPLDCGSSPQ